MHDELELPDIFTLVNHATPLISEEEFATPFVPCPTPFPVPMRVPSCNDNKFGKFALQIPNPSSQPSPTLHDSDPMEETLEWFIEVKEKANPFISQDGIDTHKSSLKYDLNSWHPLSSLSHDPLPRDFLDQLIPNPSSE